FELLLCHGTVCVVGKMRDLILQLSKSSIYSTKPCPAQECLRLADCYHRLIYYDRSNGSLNVDSFPLAGGQFRHSEIIKNDSHLRT
ncbi:hypothetical protein JEK10_16895, partial [Klebsiella quasipneumoniae]|nr:hypothetical protein [Klebsiella quasipneumoniae]